MSELLSGKTVCRFGSTIVYDFPCATGPGWLGQLSCLPVGVDTDCGQRCDDRRACRRPSDGV